VGEKEVELALEAARINQQWLADLEFRIEQIEIRFNSEVQSC